MSTKFIGSTYDFSKLTTKTLYTNLNEIIDLILQFEQDCYDDPQLFYVEVDGKRVDIFVAKISCAAMVEVLAPGMYRPRSEKFHRKSGRPSMPLVNIPFNKIAVNGKDLSSGAWDHGNGDFTQEIDTSSAYSAINSTSRNHCIDMQFPLAQRTIYIESTSGALGLDVLFMVSHAEIKNGRQICHGDFKRTRCGDQFRLHATFVKAACFGYDSAIELRIMHIPTSIVQTVSVQFVIAKEKIREKNTPLAFSSAGVERDEIVENAKNHIDY